jgi:transcriptional regulator with XRE-family HTH domain
MTKPAVSTRISRDVVNLLVSRGMTLTRIAQTLGVTKSYVSRVKAGTRNFTLDHLARLEMELGESLPVLLIKAVPRETVSPALWPLYQSALELLENTGSGRSRPARSESHYKRRRARTKAA